MIAFLVEDSKIIRDSLIPALEEVAGTKFHLSADTEAEVVLWLTRSDSCWDLVVVDLFLKQGSGLGVLDRCRNRASHQRVVLLTNYPKPEIRRRALELGADAVFDKSTELENLFDFAAEMKPLDSWGCSGLTLQISPCYLERCSSSQPALVLGIDRFNRTPPNVRRTEAPTTEHNGGVPQRRS